MVNQRNHKIKFLATGDFHSDPFMIEYLRKNIDFLDIDFVVLIGDISEKKDDFSKIFESFKDKKIFMVPGNHENLNNIEILKNYYKVHMIGNSPLIIDSQIALFGSNYLSIGEFGVYEQIVFNNLVENFNVVKNIPLKIHLSHMPPAQTKIGNASVFFPHIGGCFGVRKFLDNFSPNLTLVGHIHESCGLEEIVNSTKVVNVGKSFTIFEIDKMSKKIKKTNLKTFLE